VTTASPTVAPVESATVSANSPRLLFAACAEAVVDTPLTASTADSEMKARRSMSGISFLRMKKVEQVVRLTARG
jgi:hypothetical protein